MKRTGLIFLAAALAALLLGVGRADSAPAALPSGVTIAGVPVGGLEPGRAVSMVRAAFQVPVSLIVDDQMVLVPPATLGAVGYAKRAVNQAVAAPAGATVPLQVEVHQVALRHYLAGLAAQYGRTAVDAHVSLQRLRPVIRPDRPGRQLDRGAAAAAITQALVAGSRDPIFMPTSAVAAKVTAAGLEAPLIVIHRGTNLLDLYHGERLVRTFHVATGQAIYPTPLGRFSIVLRWKNPWWYPPTQDAWAKGLKPTPPGPGNPLGTRWMGLSAPGVGIHGTDEPGSIGYSLSHGCIRMHVPDSEWLYDHVEVGTVVFIVAA